MELFIDEIVPGYIVFLVNSNNQKIQKTAKHNHLFILSYKSTVFWRCNFEFLYRKCLYSLCTMSLSISSIQETVSRRVGYVPWLTKVLEVRLVCSSNFIFLSFFIPSQRLLLGIFFQKVHVNSNFPKN